MGFQTRKKRRIETARVVSIYALFGLAWIYGSDTLLGWLIHDPIVMVKVAVIKGSLFILSTAIILYFLINRLLCQLTSVEAQKIETLRNYETIFNATNEAIFVHDVQSGRILDINVRMLEIYGYTRDEALNLEISQLSEGTSPYSQTEAVEYVSKAMTEGPQLFEWLSRKKTGELFWSEVALRKTTFNDEERIIAVVRDISERRQLNAALLDAEWKFRALFDNGPIGVAYHRMIYDDSGDAVDYYFIDANDKYLELTGVDPRGKTVTQAFPGIENDPFDWIGTFGNVAKTGKSIHFEQYLQLNDRWYDCVGYQYSPDHFVAAFQEITVRKRAEEALKETKELFTLFMKHSPIYIYIKEVMPDGILVLQASENFQDMVGIPGSKMIGKFMSDLFPAEFADKIEADDRAVIARDEVLKIEEEYHGRYYTTIKFPLVQGDKALLAGYTIDITEQKRAEEERIRLEHQLLHAQKLESLGVLAGGIAHDFNNILTAIMGNISYAKKDLDESQPANEPLARAEKAVKRATKLAKQLLVFAKGGDPVKKLISVQQMLHDAVSLVLSGTNVQAVIDLPTDLYTINADEGQISQAFDNIIINAFQAMPDGGRLTISARNFAISDDNILTLSAGNYVQISFADEGCGIPAENVGRVFDPYFTNKAGGSGLGLASTYAIIKKHGGHISVSSLPGKGTTFDILIPGSDEPASEELKEVHAPGNAQGVYSVLVMDDDEMVRELAEITLKRLGYIVVCCKNGSAAISLYRSAREKGKPFSLVIMDLTIQGAMGGVEAARL